MFITMLKSKIHRATVTQAELDYIGSITIDSALMNAAGIFEYEKVQVVNVNNGTRLETYAICGEANSGIICLNGAAAHHAQPNDKIIIMTYVQVNELEAQGYSPKVVFVNGANQIEQVTNYERHGSLKKDSFLIFMR